MMEESRWWSDRSARTQSTKISDVVLSASGSFDGPAGTLEWISFPHGRQRVLVFTDNNTINQQRSFDTSEPTEKNVYVSLHELGILLC